MESEVAVLSVFLCRLIFSLESVLAIIWKSMTLSTYTLVVSQGSEVSISATVDFVWAGTKVELVTCPWSLLWTKILFCRILIAFHSIPLVWIRDHLSLRSRDSIIRSSRVMSGLILISFGKDLPLEINRETSIVRARLTSTGRGLVKDSGYFPSTKRSRIESGLMLFSPSDRRL